MKNIVEVKTAEKPNYFNSRSKFPYNKIMSSLEALKGTTKCVIMEKDEFTQNRVVTLRNMAKKAKIGRVEYGKRDDRWYLWLEEV